MKPRAAKAKFDLKRSRVARSAGTVELLLADPRWEDLRAATYLQMKGGRRSVRCLLIAEWPNADKALARCSVPDTDLADGRWRLSVQTLAGPRPIGADLVVDRDQLKLRQAGPTGRERFIAAGARVLDAALWPLPPDRARAVRNKARTFARTLLR